MALRDQPYLPLYIQDIMTCEKLNECSAATHGIFIKGIMCLMHKSETYGKILLKQNYKQGKDLCLGFANQLVKHLPYTAKEIHTALLELIAEKVCYLEDDFLVNKRMVKDNATSEKRATAGKSGGTKTQGKNKDFANNFAKAKRKASPEYDIDNENDTVIGIKNEKKKEPAKKQVLFRESEYFDQTKLSTALWGTQYEQANVAYYHEAALIWSDSGGNKKLDWLATVKGFMARDMKENKFVDINFKPGNNGNQQTFTGHNQQHNGKRNGTDVLADRIKANIEKLNGGGEEGGFGG